MGRVWNLWHLQPANTPLNDGEPEREVEVARSHQVTPGRASFHAARVARVARGRVALGRACARGILCSVSPLTGRATRVRRTRAPKLIILFWLNTSPCWRPARGAGVKVSVQCSLFTSFCMYGIDIAVTQSSPQSVRPTT